MKIYNATTADVTPVYELIKIYADKEIVLPRSLLSIYQQLQCLYVVKDNAKVVGVAGLHVLGQDLAEVRSLVVDPDYQQKGIGRMLVEHIIQESPKLGVERLISLTYQVKFFSKLGFQIVKRDDLPEKVWTDCVNCPKINNCDEVAMVKYLETAD
ncbi:N-acetyltransferase [Lysinibacillus sphaericus]|uniref:N-acetyltransferase n=2 Tax=Lysinibacillus TaxID=400634 RepID=A0ABY2TCI3_9BACI|nr:MULTISPECIES: N-acetyltransferase [Lysinibacillus]AHN22304.1 acetyltransferase [Lysinibacillus varians]TKI50340.1 N-acetyltransferase [Lysinibacillus tabacifolii]TKI64965.1 N-acetyltransferase [Lysinibacillus varians]UDK97399.1 N-acetyltransferase [Lysinibacillus sphaericus]